MATAAARANAGGRGAACVLRSRLQCLGRRSSLESSRHRFNALRGDVGSVASRQKSLETVGLLLGLRESPDFVEEEKGVHALLDWSTLLADADKRAWEADVKREN
eukprot:2697647-Pyramimonas_sp.AAC.1